MEALRNLIANKKTSEVIRYRDLLKTSLKEKEVNLAILPKDDLASGLVPEDVPFPKDDLLTA